MSVRLNAYWNSLESNLEGLIKKAPRIFRTAAESKKTGIQICLDIFLIFEIDVIKLLNGYLMILEKGRILSLLPKLAISVCSILTLDVSELHRTVFANRLLLPGTVQSRSQCMYI